jgi:transcriptional regulator with XRE-family HTH domain
MNITFAEQLIALRNSHGLTQQELAARSGLAQGHISEMERGVRKHPGMQTLNRLAAGFGLTTAQFLTELEKQSQPAVA